MKYVIIGFSTFLFIFCNNPKPIPNPKVHIYDQSFDSIINEFSEIEVLADSISLPEGPVWDESSKSLLFVDIVNNKVLKWNEKGGVTDFIMPSGNTGYAPNLGEGLLGANGLSLDSEGELILCQHGDRRIATIKGINILNRGCPGKNIDPGYIAHTSPFFIKPLVTKSPKPKSPLRFTHNSKVIGFERLLLILHLLFLIKYFHT